jgi:hypothetical protein
LEWVPTEERSNFRLAPDFETLEPNSQRGLHNSQSTRHARVAEDKPDEFGETCFALLSEQKGVTFLGCTGDAG